MGYSYTSQALIGFVLDRDSLFTKKKIKLFKHDYPEEMNYCPKTGVKLWNIIEEPIPTFIQSQMSLLGYRVVENGDTYYICLYLADDSSYWYFCPEDLLEARNTLMEILNEAKIPYWDFGLYSILNVN